MLVVTGRQMKEIDRTAIEEFGIPGLSLMEKAGNCLFEEVMQELKGDDFKEVFIICGAGNNGGDGYVLARKLVNRYIPVKVYSTVDPEELTGDARINYERFIELDYGITVLNSQNEINKFQEEIQSEGLIVDAILGTGLTRTVENNIEEIIHIINDSKKRIYSVDIPSGIGADNGKVYKAAIKAHKTITFQLPKLGCILYPGAEYSGELVIKDIGIPNEAIQKNSPDIFLIDKDFVKNILPHREKDIHKGNCGKLFIIAGSKGMAGAAVLACRAALRSGIGLVTAGIPAGILDIIQISVPEAICKPLGNEENIEIDISCLTSILEGAQQSDVIAIGPGMGKNPDIQSIVKKLIEEAQVPLIIDADGLNAIGERADAFFKGDKSIVITPHPGEMSRLTGLDISQINENRIDIAREYSKKWGTIVILKGARTVIAIPDGKVYLNITGNPGMAAAGSGDVLTGILSSFVSQGFSVDKAAIAAVFIHGRAGDMMAEKFGEYGLIAGDMADGVGLAIKDLLES